MAIGDCGHPAAVGVATNEIVLSDGAAPIAAPAIGVGVVAGHCEDIIAFAI